jgi:hypothetical protein
MYAIHILRADGTKEQTSIWEGETRISAEGIVFQASASGVKVTLSRGVVPLPYGSFVPDEIVPWDTEILVGDTRVRIGDPREHTPLPGGAPVAPAAKAKASPVVLVCGGLSVAILAWLVLGGTEETGLRPPPRAPELFGEAERCPTQPGQSNAALLAERDERTARAMTQRYPFAPADGIRAVELFRRAAACWMEAGFHPSSAAAAAQGERMRRRVEEDYDTSQLLLFRALRAGHLDEARGEAAILMALLGDRNDPYLDWLREVERSIRAGSLRGGDGS